jgi:hypothetical protein
MSRYVMLLAFVLAQAQPLAGAVLCHEHHDRSVSACGTTDAHHQSGTDQTHDHDEHSGDEQCAATHACTPASAVMRADGPERDALIGHRLAVSVVEIDSAPQGLRSPPFHPPKS